MQWRSHEWKFCSITEQKRHTRIFDSVAITTMDRCRILRKVLRISWWLIFYSLLMQNCLYFIVTFYATYLISVKGGVLNNAQMIYWQTVIAYQWRSPYPSTLLETAIEVQTEYYTCVCVCWIRILYVCLYVSTYVCVYYVRMYAYIYICVCMYVCMYVCKLRKNTRMLSCRHVRNTYCFKLYYGSIISNYKNYNVLLTFDNKSGKLQTITWYKCKTYTYNCISINVYIIMFFLST
jgi:hypothetical protein